MNNAELDNKIIKLDLEATIRNRPGRFVLYREMAQRARLSKDWLVDGFLGAGEASAFFGIPGDGKSVFVEDLGLHVAAGMTWHGRDVRKGTLERRALVERRLLAFQTEHNVSDIPFAVCGGTLDFRDPNVCERIMKLVSAVETETGDKVSLLIFDTISRALCGADENSSRDMGALIRATGILQEEGARHVLWIHHTPHGAERLRGHGNLEGAIDSAIHVTHDQRSAIRRATVTKANDGEEGLQITFTLKSVTINHEDGTTAPVIVPIDAPTTVTNPKKPVSKALALIVDIIRDTAAETVQPFDDNLVVRAANTDQVRVEFFRRYVAEPDAQRQAFYRAINTRSIIAQRDGKCWIV